MGGEDHGQGHEPDVTELWALLSGPVKPRPGFRESLRRELLKEQAALYGGEDGEFYAVCPFTTFCFAEVPMVPSVVRRNCPCLAASGVLEGMAARGLPLRRRWCHGLELRAAAGSR